MYTRILKIPTSSFFLLGPRATGKTTWLKATLPNAKWFNLLLTREFLNLSQNPDMFRQEIEPLKKGSWVVVDEIQKLPSLLDEVHALMNDYGDKYKFALTGSSARKIKRSKVNLLAGRAINKTMNPLTYKELGKDFDLELILSFGTLPAIFNNNNTQDKINVMDAYVSNYIKEEIKEEALVRNLEPFARFLEIAALMNAQILNISSVARDALINRNTTQSFFSILEDTLIGHKLPAWKPKVKVKEVEHPKFYLFDAGVARALSGLIWDKPEKSEKGFLLETYIFHELRSHISYSGLGGNLFYWRTAAGLEVDFIWTRGKRAIGFEIKYSNTFKKEYLKGLLELLRHDKIEKAYLIYNGKETLKEKSIYIYPVKIFLEKLSNNEIII